jgi:hypothetical protein
VGEAPPAHSSQPHGRLPAADEHACRTRARAHVVGGLPSCTEADLEPVRLPEPRCRRPGTRHPRPALRRPRPGCSRP